MEALDAIPWGALTPSALLLLAVLLILRGDVIPRRTVEPWMPSRLSSPWRRVAFTAS